MKSKILLIVVLVALGFSLKAQPLHWTESLFDPLKTSTIVKETVLKTDGTSSMKYTFTDPGTVLMFSDTIAVAAGQTWSFSIDYYDNDPQATITARVYIYDGVAGSSYLVRSTTTAMSDLAGWQTKTLSGTVPAGGAILYAAVRMQPTTPATFTSATFYADNAKLYLNGVTTDNKFENASFEDWTTPAFKIFKFAGLTPNVTGIINNSTHKVTLTVPYATDVTALVPTFTITDRVTTKVGATDQVSGTTPNNFTTPVTYTLSVLDAQGVAATQDWEVTVNTTPASSSKEITAFSFASPVANGIVNAGAHTVSLEVPFGTDVTALVPTFTLSPFATAKVGAIPQVSGTTPNNFTSPVTYTVTAEDLSTQDWVVTVTFGLPKEILTFNFGTPAVVGVVGGNTVALTVPYGTNVTALVPTITTSANTTISPLSGIAQDFTATVKYTVTSTTDATTKDWFVTVTVGSPSTEKSIIAFSFAGLTPVVNGTINAIAHTVALTVPYVTDITALIPTITLSENATVSPLSGVPQDFTTDKTYTVTAQDGISTQDWKVTVTKTPAATGTDIYSFKFNTLNPPVSGDVVAAEDSIKIVVPAETNVTALVPTIALSPFATVSPLSGDANNFTTPQTYTVTAQDGSTKAWKVRVKLGVAGETLIFFEDFENKKLIPSTFKLIKNDTYTMAAGEERWQDSSFVVSTTSRKEMLGTQVAMASTYCSNMPLTGHADRWMILPTIALRDNSILSWKAMSTTSSGNYPDDYDVIIAPAGAQGVVPSVAYFQENGNILTEVDPEKWSAFVSRPGQGLGIHEINLKTTATVSEPNGWYNRNVWIAFVCNTDLYTNPATGITNGTAGGSALAIDDIKVVNSPITGINDNRINSLNVSVFPNPSNGTFKISMQLEKSAIAEINVTDIIGRVIYNSQVPVYTGQNQVDINLANLHGGIYLLKTKVNGKTNVTKVIVR